MEPDEIYAKPIDRIVDFRFDEQVARVFPDMLRRSVPGYGSLIALSGIIAGEYAQPGSNVYDLGCSLGASTLSMRHRIQAPDCHIFSVDNSAAMVERCRELVAQDASETPVTVLLDDVTETVLENASLVVMNLTLQFIPAGKRDALVRRIYAALRPGGVFLLTEKLANEDSPMDALHAAFKRANGYSEMEISQKRSALEQVMIPESEQAHIQRLQDAGFSQVHSWFRCLQFASLLAQK